MGYEPGCKYCIYNEGYYTPSQRATVLLVVVMKPGQGSRISLTEIGVHSQAEEQISAGVIATATFLPSGRDDRESRFDQDEDAVLIWCIARTYPMAPHAGDSTAFACEGSENAHGRLCQSQSQRNTLIPAFSHRLIDGPFGSIATEQLRFKQCLVHSN